MKLKKKSPRTVVLRMQPSGHVVGVSVHPHLAAAKAQIEAEAKTAPPKEQIVSILPPLWLIIPACTVYEGEHTLSPPPDEKAIATLKRTMAEKAEEGRLYDEDLKAAPGPVGKD